MTLTGNPRVMQGEDTLSGKIIPITLMMTRVTCQAAVIRRACRSGHQSACQEEVMPEAVENFRLWTKVLRRATAAARW